MALSNCGVFFASGSQEAGRRAARSLPAIAVTSMSTAAYCWCALKGSVLKLPQAASTAAAVAPPAPRQPELSNHILKQAEGRRCDARSATAGLPGPLQCDTPYALAQLRRHPCRRDAPQERTCY